MKIALVKYGKAAYIACAAKNLSKILGKATNAELVDLYDIEADETDASVEANKLFRQLAAKKLEATLSFSAQFAGQALLGRAVDLREGIDEAIALMMARFIP